jgi:hypothetical protein
VTHLAICIPSLGTWRAEFGLCLVQMIARHAFADEEVIPYHRSDTNLAVSRYELAKAALERGASDLLWIDSDMTFPMIGAELLLMHKAPFVAASCPTRRRPLRTTARHGLNRLPSSIGKTGLEKVDGVGFGFTLVKREVFEKVPTPWFATGWVKDPETGEIGGAMSEDIYFCMNARKAGFDILVDHDLSREIGHIGEVEFTHQMVAEEAG